MSAADENVCLILQTMYVCVVSKTIFGVGM